jgi:hypothetical protein
VEAFDTVVAHFLEESHSENQVDYQTFLYPEADRPVVLLVADNSAVLLEVDMYVVLADILVVHLVAERPVAEILVVAENLENQMVEKDLDWNAKQYYLYFQTIV